MVPCWRPACEDPHLIGRGTCTGTRSVNFFAGFSRAGSSPETRGHSRHGERHQVVQVSIAGIWYLQGSEADVVKSLVVNAVGFVGVFHQLVHWQRSIIGFHYSVWDFRTGHYGVGVHDPVWVLFADFRYQQGSHAGAGSTSQWVRQLEPCRTFYVLLLPWLLISFKCLSL